jgi:hypothetical protein
MPMPSLFDDPELDDAEPQGDEGDHYEELPDDDDGPDETEYEDDDPEEPDSEDNPDVDDTTPEPDSEGDDSEASDGPGEETPERRVAELFDTPRERDEPVRLSDLVLEYKHWTNPRQFTGLDDEGMRVLADDILARSKTTEDGFIAGLLSPLLVVKIKGPNGRVDQLVLDGQRRFKATEMAAKADPGKLQPEIWVKVADREAEPVEWTEALALQYLAEVLGSVGQRQGLSGYELSESAMRLRGTVNPDTGGTYTFAQIAQRIGRSPSWVSKIFGARDKASPKLLLRWRKGEITEENFKDLAVGVADEEQDQAAEDVTAERQAGDKATARVSAKEKAAIAKQAARDTKAKAKADKEAKIAAEKAAKRAEREAKAASKKAVRGPEAELSLSPKAQPTTSEPDKADTPPKPAKATKPKPLQFAVIEDLVAEAKKHPPTHDLVKGIMFGIQVASGLLDMETLPKPWHAYILRLSGAKPVKASKKARKK